MRRRLWLALSVILVLAGVAHAQPPFTMVIPTMPAPPPILLPSPLNNPLPPELVAPQAPPGDLAGTGLRGFLKRHGLLCASHHFWFGCGNLRSELTHILGSCRTFYGEPCLPREARDGGFVEAGGGSRWGILGRLGCKSCLE